MPERAPELLMPVTEASAAMQFFVEAMKANTATLQRVSKSLETVMNEQSETLKLVHDTRERVIKIESGNQRETIIDLRKEIVDLKAEVDRLKAKEDRREGALSGFNWTLRNGPVLIGIVVLIIIVLKANGKI